MFIIKNKYFLIIENIKDINLKNIKIRNKFFIIYRNNKNIDSLSDLFRFRQICKSKAIKFYIANDIKLAILLNSDGIYLSSYNKGLKFLNYRKLNFEIIGSAHNLKDIKIKEIQKVQSIFISSLFKKNKNYLGLNKFKIISKYTKKNIVALGGVSKSNLIKLKLINISSFAGISYFE